MKSSLSWQALRDLRHRVTSRTLEDTAIFLIRPHVTKALACSRHCRLASSSSSSRRWQSRQHQDVYSRNARLQGLRSRAAFKLMQINDKYNIFKAGQTVVDLGFAPGSWSQVAVDRTQPNGQVIGIDIIPAQPPKGVSTIQGDFLSPRVRLELCRYISKRVSPSQPFVSLAVAEDDLPEAIANSESIYIDTAHRTHPRGLADEVSLASRTKAESLMSEADFGEMVDVVLSDMSDPWEQDFCSSARSLINPYLRMMNTSGNLLRDHIGSMNLCDAALQFAFQTLKTGGSFICKFYQGSDDKDLETKLKVLFAKVYRDKPDSSRSFSKESYFVATRKRKGILRSNIW